MDSTKEQNPIYSRAQIYLQFFYLTGNSPQIRPPPNQSKFKRFLTILPAILLIFATICLYIVGTWLQTQYKLYEYEVIVHMYLVGETVVDSIIFSQCFIYGSHLRSVIGHLDFLQNFFQQKLRHQIPIQKHLDRIRCQSLYCILIYIGGMMLYSFMRSVYVDHGYDYLGILMDWMQLPTIFSTVHVVFYIRVCTSQHSCLYVTKDFQQLSPSRNIQLIESFLLELNEVIKMKHLCGACDFNTEFYVRQRFIAWTGKCRRQMCDDVRLKAIKRFKLVYYRLWRCTQHMNNFFGLSIGTIVLWNFVDASFGVYWGYQILMSDYRAVQLIGPFTCLTTTVLTLATLINSAQGLYQQVQ